MRTIYNTICTARTDNKKLIGLLIDPDKTTPEEIPQLSKIWGHRITHILIGGSLVETDYLDELLTVLREHTSLPILLFPGDPSQISDKADGLLFLTLLSGDNPLYLNGHHIQAAPILEKHSLEIISTAYLLIDGDHISSVERVSNTKPLPQNNIEIIKNTALAGQYLGCQLIYLEAGSGARKKIDEKIIKKVRQHTKIPLIVGGGIRDKEAIDTAHEAGADMVIIGTAFENDSNFFKSF